MNLGPEVSIDPPRVILDGVGKFYRDVAKLLAGQLVCGRCGRKQELSVEQAAEYLRTGWPKCCGETIQIKPNKTEDDDASKR